MPESIDRRGPGHTVASCPTAMPEACQIRRPSEAEDRPRLTILAAVALLCVTVGVLTARWTLESPAPRAEEPGAPAPSSPVGPEGDLANAEGAGPADEEPPEPVADPPPSPEVRADSPGTPSAGPAPLPAAGGEPAPTSPRLGQADALEPNPADTEPSGRTEPRVPALPPDVLIGRVAYLRCEGAQVTPGPYPCPRDRLLEDAVRQILLDLPRCAESPAGPGESDVRLSFTGTSSPQVHLGPPRSGARGHLDGAPVLACLRPRLQALATQIVADQLLVSFRFSLEPAGSP